MAFKVSKRILSTILFISIIGIALTLMTIYDIQGINQRSDDRLQVVKHLEWVYISGVLTENYDKAQMQADSIRFNIVHRIEMAYDNDKDLNKDLDKISKSKLYTILNEEIKDKYLNVKNDANDPMIFTKEGMVADLSKQPPFKLGPSGVRRWETDYPVLANPGLSKHAIEAIVEMDKRPIFWEPMPNELESHFQICDMSLSELEKVYNLEGIDGLKTYEFLSYAPIYEDKDLVGRPVITSLVVHNDDVRVVYVVQPFNLYDVLNKQHKVFFTETYRVRTIIEQQRASNIQLKIVSYLLTLLLLVASIAGLLLAFNECNCDSSGKEADKDVADGDTCP